jgi:DNA polymerase III alpha subunit
MKTTEHGEMVFDSNDLSDLIMQGQTLTELNRVVVDHTVDIESLIKHVEDPGQLITWTFPADSNVSVPDWDSIQQKRWHMPTEYQQMDIAAHVLALCKTDAELQRTGEELMLYQEKNMFDLLKYLKYLVDVMKTHQVIWGVGRGSSVASYILYLLGVHRVDSMFYDLDPREFLR